jgi:outer membrane protein OmpA-like peptidoglycan-associated protein
MRLPKENTIKIIKIILLQVTFLISINRLYAQTEFPAGDFWALDAGLGTSGILVDGLSFQVVIDPKLWLSPPLMVGSRLGINYSAENGEDKSNILTFEGQVYMRWNFLRLGKNENKKVDIFAQAGLGLISAYRGKINDENVFDDVTRTRGSLLADAGIGITVPLTERWHIEAMGRGGYPHLFGASVTAGYKFPLPEKIKYEKEEVVKTMQPNDIIKVIKITSIEYIIFGPDIGSYNVGIDRDAQQLNELILDQIAKDLKENSDYRVRLEGHANPLTINHSEAEDLMALSALRSNTVAEQLKQRGVSDDQMVLIAYGGTRNATNEWDVRNRNRRVELMVIQVDQ